jgi:ABC-type iron transport system FetAB permease component
MNWKLIIIFSGFGLVMGIASVLGFTRGVEGFLWLAIAIFCAAWISAKVSAKYFLNGFWIGLIAGVISPLTQFIFFPIYLANNPESAEAFNQIPAGLNARYFILVTAPFIGVIIGVVLGVFSWGANQIRSRIARPTKQ